jgi:hypothetical protein
MDVDQILEWHEAYSRSAAITQAKAAEAELMNEPGYTRAAAGHWVPAVPSQRGA